MEVLVCLGVSWLAATYDGAATMLNQRSCPGNSKMWCSRCGGGGSVLCKDPETSRCRLLFQTALHFRRMAAPEISPTSFICCLNS